MPGSEIVESEKEINGSGKRVWGPWATIGLGLVVFIVSVIVQVVIIVIFIIAELVNETESGLAELEFFNWLDMGNLGLLISLSVIISSVVCIGLIMIFIKLRRGDTVTGYLGLKSISFKVVLVSLAVSAGFIALEVLANRVFQVSAESDIMTKAYDTSILPALFWIALIAFGPIFEEVMFRGFLFKGLRHSRIGVAGAIIVTSVLWAGSHLQYGLFQIAWIFVLGVALGLMRYRTGSLWAPILMHIFNNLIAVLFIALEVGF